MAVGQSLVFSQGNGGLSSLETPQQVSVVCDIRDGGLHGNECLYASRCLPGNPHPSLGLGPWSDEVVIARADFVDRLPVFIFHKLDAFGLCGG